MSPNFPSEGKFIASNRCFRVALLPWRNVFKQPLIANPPTSYRSLSGPPGPKSPKSLKKVSRGLRPRGPKKSGKSLEKVPNRHFRDFFQTFRTFSRLFPDFWGPRGRRPRETFFRLFGDFGPGGPERLLYSVTLRCVTFSSALSSCCVASLLQDTVCSAWLYSPSENVLIQNNFWTKSYAGAVRVRV